MRIKKLAAAMCAATMLLAASPAGIAEAQEPVGGVTLDATQSQNNKTIVVATELPDGMSGATITDVRVTSKVRAPSPLWETKTVLSVGGVEHSATVKATSGSGATTWAISDLNMVVPQKDHRLRFVVYATSPVSSGSTRGTLVSVGFTPADEAGAAISKQGGPRVKTHVEKTPDRLAAEKKKEDAENSDLVTARIITISMFLAITTALVLLYIRPEKNRDE